MRRLARTLVALGAATVGVLGVTAAPSSAQDAPESTAAPIDVIDATGLFDPIVVDFVHSSIDKAERDGAQVLVIRINSKGAVVSDAEMARLARRIKGASVPIGIWVGPSGARALGAPGQLLAAADVTGMAPGTRIGDFGDPLAAEGVDFDFGSATERLQSFTIGADEARNAGALKLGVDDRGTPTLGDFVVVLDGVTARGRTLETAEVVEINGQPRRQIPQELPRRSTKLPLFSGMAHSIASPPVAYLLLLVGLSLLVFEFFTAGVGVAGVVGALSLLASLYGLATLPTNWWAVGILVASAVAYAIDVQTGVPRFWTGVGTLLLVIGSLSIYDGLSVGWVALVGGLVGMLLAYIVGMPTMVRTRFATPTIGREWMIGEIGEAEVAVDPEGVVSVQGAKWRARTNRATPISRGGRVRVVAIDGVTLEVEPEEGGARDYRERRSATPGDLPDAPRAGEAVESAN